MFDKICNYRVYHHLWSYVTLLYGLKRIGDKISEKKYSQKFFWLKEFGFQSRGLALIQSQLSIFRASFRLSSKVKHLKI